MAIEHEEKFGDVLAGALDAMGDICDSFSGKETEGPRRSREARDRGENGRTLDWVKAARILKERGAVDATAGLAEDFTPTRVRILKDGKPVVGDELDHGYLASLWASPCLVIDDDDEVTPCWKAIEGISPETDEWGDLAKLRWPEEALAEFNGDEGRKASDDKR